MLWPSLTAAAPSAAAALEGLSGEHHQLDAALDTLAGTPVRDDGDRPALTATAVAVRDLVDGHLLHKEPLLFPALRAHMPDEEWAAFSRAVIASAPPAGATS